MYTYMKALRNLGTYNLETIFRIPRLSHIDREYPVKLPVVHIHVTAGAAEHKVGPSRK